MSISRILLCTTVVCLFYVPAFSQESDFDIKKNQAKSTLKTFQQSVFNGCIKKGASMGHTGKDAENKCLCVSFVAGQCVDMDKLLSTGGIEMNNKRYIQRIENECQ